MTHRGENNQSYINNNHRFVHRTPHIVHDNNLQYSGYTRVPSPIYKENNLRGRFEESNTFRVHDKNLKFNDKIYPTNRPYETSSKTHEYLPSPLSKCYDEQTKSRYREDNFKPPQHQDTQLNRFSQERMLGPITDLREIDKVSQVITYDRLKVPEPNHALKSGPQFINPQRNMNSRQGAHFQNLNNIDVYCHNHYQQYQHQFQYHEIQQNPVSRIPTEHRASLESKSDMIAKRYVNEFNVQKESYDRNKQVCMIDLQRSLQESNNQKTQNYSIKKNEKTDDEFNFIDLSGFF
jgi:hypothetical protein